MPSKSSSTDFLNAHKIHDNIYVTGMFYKGITIYNQQVRTLNLIYFLTLKKIIKNNFRNRNGRIVIIGAGVAGITAAIALKRLGFDVNLLEEKSLLLHLQHGCFTRQIHPNLYLWPREGSLKPFTELPFLNWEANDAARIEQSLINQFRGEQNSPPIGNGKISTVYNVCNTKVNLSRRSVTYSIDENKETIQYDFLLLATGFGLERYVGRRETTKSYWRNEDLGQLRLKDQINKFFISGMGDGGVSDAFRLALTAFDPLVWVKRFEKIEKKKWRLLDRLKQPESDSRNVTTYNYCNQFESIYNDFQFELNALIRKHRRKDIAEIILNGSKSNFEDNLAKGQMSFFNAWMVFLLKKLGIIEYRGGSFPDNCGQYIFAEEEVNRYGIIVRHGTDKNMDHFAALHHTFKGISQKLAKRQQKNELNYFSTIPHWDLKYWSKTQHSGYIAKDFIVSRSLKAYCDSFLSTLEGIINCYAEEQVSNSISYRMTLHRLVRHNDKFYFQQISPYFGTRKGKDQDPGRLFEISEGVVGLSMRTNTAYSLVETTLKELDMLDYNRLDARPLNDKIKSFLLIPIPSAKKNGAVLCLYLDTNESKLVRQSDFRKLILWTFTSFIKRLEGFNVSAESMPDEIASGSKRTSDLNLFERESKIIVHNDELTPYWDKGQLIIMSNKLIDIYDK